MEKVMALRTPIAAPIAAPVINHGADAHFDGYLTALEGREKALRGFLSIVGDAPTYELWESFRLGFGAVYRAKRPKAKDDAVNTAWGRFVADVKTYVTEMNLLQEIPTKPKAASPEAVRKQTARTVPAAVAAATTINDLEKIKVPAGADGAALALAVAQKRVALAKQSGVIAAKNEKAALKGLKDQVIAATKSCTSAKNLEAALVALQAKPTAAAEAKAKAKAEVSA